MCLGASPVKTEKKYQGCVPCVQAEDGMSAAEYLQCVRQKTEDSLANSGTR